MTSAFKEAGVAKLKADVWKNGTCTSDSCRGKFVIIKMGLHCIQGIARGVGILEISATRHRFLHSCIHDLKEFIYTQCVDCPCCMMNRRIRKTFFTICAIFAFHRLFSLETNNFVNIF